MNVAVLLGGDSSERDVSIASAAQVVKALRERGHRVWAVDTLHGWLDGEQEAALFSRRVSAVPPAAGATGAPSLLAILNEVPGDARIDLWFLALHGGSGEDGRMQGLLEMTGIPYTGSRVLGSAVAMDKDIAKRLLAATGVPTPDWLMAPSGARVVGERLGWPVVVKPSKQGSTVGLSVVRDATALDNAVAAARAFDDEVMIERFIPGRELTCPVLGDGALAVGEIILKRGEIFDYEAKYQPGGAEEVFPADIPAETARQVQQLSLQAHRALKLKGYSRSDFRLDRTGKLWCLEVNTLPGLTAMSLLPQAAGAQGISFGELVERICRLALEPS
ncbi:MAG: D-alanine--D-alanine ligase [Betaproteobacteria bacterium]|nr:D-alanine--D-alanine ligase [Betaproteobacteria bacterium]